MSNSEMMVFVGEHERLCKGMTALAMESVDFADKVLAQFDSKYLVFGGKNPYAFNWWEFNKSDFVSTEEYFELYVEGLV